jgi:hypothetical protein
MPRGRRHAQEYDSRSVIVELEKNKSSKAIPATETPRACRVQVFNEHQAARLHKPYLLLKLYRLVLLIMLSAGHDHS